jgi:hypothetical protein
MTSADPNWPWLTLELEVINCSARTAACILTGVSMP